MENEKCATIGCAAPAERVITWPDWDGTTITELVCEQCGAFYAHRDRHVTLHPAGVAA